MENINEQYNINDILGVERHSNAIVVDIVSPVGSGMHTSCAAIIGLAATRAKTSKGTKENLALFAVGAMNEELMIHYLVNMVCDSIVAYLGAARGSELVVMLGRAMPMAISHAIAKQCERGESIADVIAGMESHMEEVAREIQRCEEGEEDDEESEDE